jgi:hypothetical protein
LWNIADYPAYVDNIISAQINFEGIYEKRQPHTLITLRGVMSIKSGREKKGKVQSSPKASGSVRNKRHVVAHNS